MEHRRNTALTTIRDMAATVPTSSVLTTIGREDTRTTVTIKGDTRTTAITTVRAVTSNVPMLLRPKVPRLTAMTQSHPLPLLTRQHRPQAISPATITTAKAVTTKAVTSLETTSTTGRVAINPATTKAVTNLETIRVVTSPATIRAVTTTVTTKVAISHATTREDTSRKGLVRTSSECLREVEASFRVPNASNTRLRYPIPTNRSVANAGLCSRREADEFILQGLIKVNGEVVTELGTKISHSDVVEYDEKVVALEKKCYILLNKPKDCVTTSDDPNGRLTVMDLVKGACNERIYPVGRLDRNTTGVLLLTNAGDLASKLTHPKFVKKKIYHVWTDKDIAEDDMQRIADGIELDDGPIHADAISYATETDRNQAGIEIHSGRNRIVRRIFESLGYHVTKLDRVYFAGLTKKNLPRGRWRYLTQEEVNYLKMGSFE